MIYKAIKRYLGLGWVDKLGYALYWLLLLFFAVMIISGIYGVDPSWMLRI